MNAPNAVTSRTFQQGYRVLYRETHVLLDELAKANIDGTRKDYMAGLASVPLLIIDDLDLEMAISPRNCAAR